MLKKILNQRMRVHPVEAKESEQFKTSSDEEVIMQLLVLHSVSRFLALIKTFITRNLILQ